MTTLKRFLLAFCLTLLLAGAAHARTYPDVPIGSNHYNAVTELTKQGIIQGYPDGTFRPNGTINRAEAVKILAELTFSKQEISQALSPHLSAGHSYAGFPDVPVQAWFSRYVALSRQHQIVKGYPDGRFLPANTINFAEALKVILESHDAPVYKYPFRPDPLLYVKKDDWFQPYLNYAWQKNLINTQKFQHPARAITRGEFVEAIYRLQTLQQQNLSRFESKKAPHSNEYTITIPALGIVDLNVTFANIYNEKGALNVLNDGLGQYLAPPGQGNKTVMFGHSSSYSYDTSPYTQILKTINQLKNGDQIYVNYQEKGYIYEIFQSQVIPSSQEKQIVANPQANQLTLYTCWPPNSVSQRYVVHAKPVQ